MCRVFNSPSDTYGPQSRGWTHLVPIIWSTLAAHVYLSLYESAFTSSACVVLRPSPPLYTSSSYLFSRLLRACSSSCSLGPSSSGFFSSSSTSCPLLIHAASAFAASVSCGVMVRDVAAGTEVRTP